MSGFLGDVLVRQPSAYGRDLFPDTEVHIHGGQFGLLDREAIGAALRRWLA